MIRIDAHSHLWLKQDTTVDGKRILSLKNGRSIFMDEEVQMVPPFMIDSVNSAEVFLSNMNYAQVGAAVVVQEVIDGNQNEYLTQVQQQYPDRFFCMGMAWNLDEAKAFARQQGKPCRFPEYMRHNIESLGGDVVATAKDCFGIEMEWPEDGKMPFMLFVTGLLRP